MLANARLIYQQMFGAENFSFHYCGYKFICLNSNSREVGFNGTIPDVTWLENEINTISYKQKGFVFSHVSPFSTDFDPQLSGVYASVLARGNKVRYSIHGHDHNFSLSQPYGPPVHYLIAPSVNKKKFALVKVRPDTTIVNEIFY
jgi:3',5'-cyclic-AMP phosphodiesterase